MRNDLFEKLIGDSLVLAFPDEHGLPDIGHACCLEGVAVDVWRLLKEGKDESSIVRILGGEYQVDSCTLERDVHGCLAEMAARGLVESED